VRKRLSLHARLLLIAFVTGLAALTFAWFAIGGILEGFVRRGVDEKLDTQVAVLARALTPDGRLDRSRVVELPNLGDIGSGWGWRVSGPAGQWQGGTGIAELVPDHGPPPPEPTRPRPGHGRGPGGAPLYLRRQQVETATGPVEIAAAAPQDIIDRPLRVAMGSLLGALALLALGLGLATFTQLRFGLRPLRTLRDAVADVRAGRARQIPGGQPREIQPLTDEVNALIGQNEITLARARGHLANLAHGLKTPLATLLLKLRRDGAGPETLALAGQLEQRIAHHLSRARSASPGAGRRARTPVVAVVGDLIDAMRRIHAERGLAFTATVPEALFVAVERQDLEELLGNLLDNAARHARRQVLVTVAATDAAIRVAVEDDGPGMEEVQIGPALQAGARLDETSVGYGFGLHIVRELAELYDGRLELSGHGALGGLSVAVDLPRQH
jgi:signal transduction histidine kinase